MVRGDAGRHGPPDEAEKEIQRAVEADPTSLIINTVAASFRLLARDYDGGLDRFRKTLEMDPGFDRARWGIVHAYMMKAMNAEAEKELAHISSATAVRLLTERGRIAAMAGRRSEALRAVQELETLSRREHIPSLEPALVWVALGDKDHAFVLLERACDERDPAMQYVKLAPSLELLRSDPRYRKLLKCLRLE